MKKLDYSDSEQAALQLLMQDNPINSVGQALVECLNLYKARMVPPHFCHLMTGQAEMLNASKTKTPYV